MPPDHPDRQLAVFLSTLAALEDMLRSHGQSLWADRIHELRQTAGRSDGRCVPAFLALFGGMGSLNDLILDAPASVNASFARTRTRAHALATGLLRSEAGNPARDRLPPRT